MEEVVRAFNYVIEKGWVCRYYCWLSDWLSYREPNVQTFYWATSEWSAREIEEAHRAYFAVRIWGSEFSWMVSRCRESTGLDRSHR